uniref:Transthyretin-like family protein n=1 Tax=Elaeophora elaphi TaxID=1147741 RepID=A0A0R3RQB2_9BILA
MKAVIVLLALLSGVVSFRSQSVAIRGRLMCGSNPASNVRVKLWEEDTGVSEAKKREEGKTVLTRYTDGNGEFLLKGDTVELTPIDPVFKVYHDCDDGIKPGKRKVKFKIPQSYVTNGKTPKKVFDIGTLNLETIFHVSLVRKKLSNLTSTCFFIHPHNFFISLIPNPSSVKVLKSILSSRFSVINI